MPFNIRKPFTWRTTDYPVIEGSCSLTGRCAWFLTGWTNDEQPLRFIVIAAITPAACEALQAPGVTIKLS